VIENDRLMRRPTFVDSLHARLSLMQVALGDQLTASAVRFEKWASEDSTVKYGIEFLET
jgi:hypothetical protein